VSVVRESTQASAAANKERDEMPIPQLTQEGKFSSDTPVVMITAFH